MNAAPTDTSSANTPSPNESSMNAPLMNTPLTNARRWRLTLVISSLQAGGAERVLSRMASYWAARGHDVEIVTYDRPNARPFYPLHPEVRVRGLDLLRDSRHPLDALWNTAVRVRRVRRAIVNHRPDAVISFLNHVNVVTLLATRGLDLPTIVSERADPAQVPLSTPWPALRRWSYRYARSVVMQTHEAAAYFAGDQRIRTTVIGNAIAPAPSSAAATSGAPPGITAAQGVTAARSAGTPSGGADMPRITSWITGVGRLDPQKGFDLLLRAFAAVAASHPSWGLRIVGDGKARAALTDQARALGLADRVELTGRVDNVFPLLAAADLFVLSSRFEGFPNVLGEAMAAGLPVIAFDCPSGPSAMIRHGIDGLLIPVEDVSGLAAAIDRLIANPAERAARAARAPAVVERYSEAAIMNRWEELLRP
jgi:GalNAc-alpha-(1->4)-GalNAc-alpha-(1->3)-diNAcBac-PP-undecaprenol alpha-1,4-N-acetyl-D-galactosaminyltransferase